MSGVTANTSLHQKENRMQDSEPGKRLGELIKKAIADCELTHSEHQEIITLAHSDLVIDDQERQLLAQLQQMVANGAIKKVRG
jgi:hypothetical protein